MNQEKTPHEEDDFGNNPVEPDQDETRKELPNSKRSIDSNISNPNDAEKPPGNSTSKIINHDVPDEDA